MHTTKNPATIFPLRQYGGRYDMFICRLAYWNIRKQSKDSNEGKVTDLECEILRSNLRRLKKKISSWLALLPLLMDVGGGLMEK